MDAASGTKTVNILAFSSTRTRRMPNPTNLAQQALQTCPSTVPEMLGLCSSSKATSLRFPAQRRQPCLRSRNSSTLHLARCSMKPGIDSNSARNRNPAIELDKSSIAQEVEASSPNRSLESCSSGLVFDLGPENSWDNKEIGSPVVKRYLGDNEERWHMWYHGRGSGKDSADCIGLAVSSNGIHWSRAAEHARSAATEGMVMDCSKNWWAFDRESIMPAEMVLMSSPMYSAVYWLYYTGYSSSNEVDLSGTVAISLGNPERHRYGEAGADSDANGKLLKSLPGLACSQDGRHWARIEGDHHSGALLDVGTGTDWDSLFIASPRVVIHDNDDLRMYYYSFEKEKGQFSLGLARSRDGIRWIKCGKIMGGGPSGAFDELGIKNACVVRNTKEENYLMAYEAVAADGKRSIGMAVSPDGLKNWTKMQEGPVLQPSEEDGWDNVGVGSPCLVQMEDNSDDWRLYYQGFGQGGRTGIGMAASKGCYVGSFRRWSGISA